MTGSPNSCRTSQQNPRVQQIRGKVRTADRGRQARAEDEDVQRSRRHLRGHALPVRDRPDDGGIRRGESRLGRRIRGLSRPDRSAALPSAVQLADIRSRDRGRGGGIRARRRPGGGGADVRRFHGPRGRRDFQPALEVAGDVGGPTDDAGGAAHLRGGQVRRAAFAGLDRAGAPHSRD